MAVSAGSARPLHGKPAPAPPAFPQRKTGRTVVAVRPVSEPVRTCGPAMGRASAPASAPEQIDDREQDDGADKGGHQRPPVKGVAAKMAATEATAEQQPAADRTTATNTTENGRGWRREKRR